MADSAQINDSSERLKARERLEQQGRRVTCYVLVDGDEQEQVRHFHTTLPALAWVARVLPESRTAGQRPAALIGDMVLPLTEDEQQEWSTAIAEPAPDRLVDYDELPGTADVIELDEYGLADPDRIGYRPTSWRYLPLVFDGVEIGEDDVFVDFGAGKGRVLLEAAMRPFARVIGVEISDGLAQIAKANVDLNRERLRSEVEVIVADAAAYEVPDDVTIGYFYNPFRGTTFNRVMSNIVASLDRRPRRLRLIYGLPTMPRAIEATGRFDVVRRIRFGPAATHEMIFYESR